MEEIELTYLVQSLPEGLKECNYKEIIDVYLPKVRDHPQIRIRKFGDKFEMTKKQPIREGDTSHFEEQTIILDEEEFNDLLKIDGKKVRKQ